MLKPEKNKVFYINKDFIFIEEIYAGLYMEILLVSLIHKF